MDTFHQNGMNTSRVRWDKINLIRALQRGETTMTWIVYPEDFWLGW